MRRVLVILSSVLLLMLATAAPALGAKPEHSHEGAPPPLVFAAGEVCDFALTIETLVDRSKTSVWEAADGTVRMLTRGFASGTATNTDDDISLSEAGGFRIDIVIHPDGAVDVEGSGTLVAYYFPGDAIEGLSAGIYEVRGHVTEQYAPDGSLVAASFSGHAVDLCEALAPPA
jgi:hypothetical protein